MTRTKSVRLGREEMDLIKLFTAITGVNTLDCYILHEEEQDGTINDRIVYMVNNIDLSKSVGKNGINVKKLKEKLSKNIDIIAYSKDLNRFIRNLFFPAKIIKIEEQIRNDANSGKKKVIVMVEIRSEDKGRAIGKFGRNIRKANIFVKRHFQIDHLIIC